MANLSISLSGEDAAILHNIATAHHITDSDAAAAGLRAYLRFESEQIARIRDGITAADRGEFVPGDEMDAFFARMGANT